MATTLRARCTKATIATLNGVRFIVWKGKTPPCLLLLPFVDIR